MVSATIQAHRYITLEFTKLATLVRYDMLGYEQEEKGHLSELFDLQ